VKAGRAHSIGWWNSGHRLEWAEIKQDLKALQTVTIEES
jgi:hypothetical protein